VVGIVLGVSMATSKVRMVLVEGENADGVTVDQDDFDVTDQTSEGTASAQVLSAILGTRESSAESGYQLRSSGVAFTDHYEAAALRDALYAHKIENVMLVSAFMAAAALTQAVGDATNHTRTALLFVEPETATLAVVDAADGSIADIRRQVLSEDDDQAVSQLVGLVASAEWLNSRPDGLFLVGSGIDVPMIKPALQAATSLHLCVPEEPELALARGAALASANAPLFVSSTAAFAYAQDPGTGGVDPSVLADSLAVYAPVESKSGRDNVAYSAVPDEDADADTQSRELVSDAAADESPHRRRPVLLVGSALAVVSISAVVALEIALAMGIRPTVALRPSPNENLIAPAPQAGPPPRVSAPLPRIELPSPVAAPKPFSPPVIAPIPAAPPVAPIPVVPVPVPIPMAPGRVPFVEGPHIAPRVPAMEPRGRLPEARVPFERGPSPRFGAPPEAPFEHGHGGFGGPPQVPFGGGGHGGFGGPFGGIPGFGGGGHGLPGFGGGFGGGGHGFGGFGGGHGGGHH
jgi:hypothetical protein